MKIETTTRNDGIPSALRQYAEERLSGIERFGDEIADGEIVLDVESGEVCCEMILHRRHRGEPIVANDRAEDGRAAVDRVVEKLERQFIKIKEKLTARNRRHRAAE